MTVAVLGIDLAKRVFHLHNIVVGPAPTETTRL